MSVSSKMSPLLTTFENCGHRFPSLWQYMLPEEFSYLHVPKERKVNCENCNKVHTGGYSPTIKCCTYFPQIPNFMLGLALKDDACRESVLEIIEAGWVLPEGTIQPPIGVQLFADEYVKDRFGSSVLLRCPFLDKEHHNCRVYAYRSAVCASFFCENEHGDPGDNYWEALQEFVRQAEIALYQWAMTEAGIDSVLYNQRLDSLADKLPSLHKEDNGSWAKWVREYLFGDFFGKEVVFLEKCAQLVSLNKENLYKIVTSQTTTMAFKYEKALENFLTEAQRREIAYLPETMGEPVPVGDLWYKLQLKTRQLWDLPFNEGTVVLNPDVDITPNPQSDELEQLHKDCQTMVTIPGKTPESKPLRTFLDSQETSLLGLFEQPQVLGEALFERFEIATFDRARDFLAQCLRKSILLHHGE